MGNGRLKRIAALTSLATTSVMVAGVANVPALVGLPDPTVTTTVPTTTVPTTTVPSTTVTVPSTPVTPQTTVTTPTVKTPTVTTPTVKKPTVTTPTVRTPSGTQSPASGDSGGGGGGGGGGTTIQQQTSAVRDTVSGVTSGTSTNNTVSGVKGTVSGAAGGGTGSGAGTAGGTNPALQALSAFDGGGPGGTAGPGGSGSGGGTFGGPGGGGGGLPAMLSAAGAKQLRAALELFAECMSAITPIDRQVLSMRAGGAGATPLSRPQVASRLGVSTRQVRLSERRGLTGLRAAAEQTGCAGPVGGPFAVSSIGPLPLAALAMTPGVVTPATVASADGGSGYVPARQAEPGVESPLARLTGDGGSGPAWLVVLVTVLLSVSIAGLMRELRDSVGTHTHR